MVFHTKRELSQEGRKKGETIPISYGTISKKPQFVFSPPNMIGMLDERLF